MAFPMKALVVLFVAPLPEAHVLVVAPCAICPWLYHMKHSKAVAYNTRLPQLCENRITIASPARRFGGPQRSPLL
jgi:hypothetical protein